MTLYGSELVKRNFSMTKVKLGLEPGPRVSMCCRTKIVQENMAKEQQNNLINYLLAIKLL